MRIESDLFSFDGTEKVCSGLYSINNTKELEVCIGNNDFIPRGNGLSYCGASLSKTSMILSGIQMNRILEFDEKSLIITVESGITIGETLRFLSKAGLWLSVVPGHPNITIGGCVAFNIHGKNQYSKGNFKECILEFTLYHPDIGYITCSRLKHKSIFDLTIGGAGLTGFITSVKLKVFKPDSLKISRKRIYIHDLGMLPELLDNYSSDAVQIFSWHNLNSKGDGYLFVDNYINTHYENTHEDNHYAEHFVNAQTRRINIFQYLYPLVNFKTLNSGLTSFYRISNDLKTLSLFDSHFPLISASYYYKIFGKRGFREYQCIVPLKHWNSFVYSLRKLISESGVTVTLASSKYFRGENTLLNFTGNGICLTLNLSNNNKSIEMLNKLDQIAIDYEAIVNISKDSRLVSSTTQRIFVEYDKFKHELALFDQKRRINSLLRKRLDV